MLWKIPFSLVIFNLQIINSFFFFASKNWTASDFNVFFLACYHSTSVLTVPFNHFLYDCSALCFLNFVKLKSNMLEVYTGSPMQLVSSEPGFDLKQAKQKASRKWRQRRRENVIYISEVANAVRVILEENTSVFR